MSVDVQSYCLFGVVSLKNLFHSLFSTISKEHYNLVTVRPWHVLLQETEANILHSLSKSAG